MLLWQLCVVVRATRRGGQLEMTRDQPLWLLVAILAIVPSIFQEGCFMSSHLIMNSSSMFEQNISIITINVTGIWNIILSKSARFILQVFLIDITFTYRIFCLFHCCFLNGNRTLPVARLMWCLSAGMHRCRDDQIFIFVVPWCCFSMQVCSLLLHWEALECCNVCCLWWLFEARKSWHCQEYAFFLRPCLTIPVTPMPACSVLHIVACAKDLHL